MKRILIFIIGISFMFLACEETVNEPVTIETDLPDVSGAYSNFKFANFITNYDRIDVEIDGYRYAQGLPKNHFSRRFDINAGEHSIVVKNGSGHTLFEANQIFFTNQEVTYLLSGYHSSISTNSLTLQRIFEGKISEVEGPASGKALLKISNWAADSVGNSSIGLLYNVVNTTSGDTVLNQNSSGLSLFSSKQTDITPGKYKITFHSFDNNHRSSSTLDLENGKIYNFICAGDPGRHSIIIDQYVPFASRPTNLYP